MTAAGSGPLAIPEEGVPAEELLREMEALARQEQHAEDGRTFAYVYTTGSA
jgi:hypothetical protein